MTEQNKLKVLAYISGATLGIFVLFTALKLYVPLFAKLDTWASDKIISLHNDFLTRFLVLFTEVFNSTFMGVAIFGFAVLLVLEHRKRLVLSIVGAFLFGLFGFGLLKSMLALERPIGGLIEIGGWSYPSGHATLAAIVFLSVAYMYRHVAQSKILEYVFYFLCSSMALMVGISRMYLGVHWLSDIIGGLLIGTFCFTATLFVQKSLAVNSKK